MSEQKTTKSSDDYIVQDDASCRAMSAPPCVDDESSGADRGITLRTLDGKNILDVMGEFVDSSEEEEEISKPEEKKPPVPLEKKTKIYNKENFQKESSQMSEKIRIDLEKVEIKESISKLNPVESENLLGEEVNIKEEISHYIPPYLRKNETENIKETLEIKKEENSVEIKKTVEDKKIEILEPEDLKKPEDPNPENLPLKKPRYTLEEIFSVKERCSVEIVVGKNVFESKRTNVPRRKSANDNVSLFRLDMNRIAESNAGEVISRVRSLKILNKEEMEKIAQVFFDKVVKEKVFVDTYIFALSKFKENLLVLGEKSSPKGRTIFFGEIIRLCQEAIKYKDSWNSPVPDSLTENLPPSEEKVMDSPLNTSNVSLVDQKYQEEFAIEEMKRIKAQRKERYLGTIRFIALMYSHNMISYNPIGTCIKSLLSEINEESIEVLCFLVKNTLKKFLLNDRKREAEDLLKILEVESQKMDNRVKFLVLDTVEECIPQLNAPVKQNQGTVRISSNRFTGLKVEEEKIVEGLNEESLTRIKTLIEETNVLNEEELKRLSLSVKEKFTNKKILYEGILHLMTEGVNFPHNIKFLTILLKEPELTDFNVGYNKVKENLEDIKIDSPRAPLMFNTLTKILSKLGYLFNPNPPLTKKEEEEVNNKIQELKQGGIIDEILK